jgi:hypothetical protein
MSLSQNALEQKKRAGISSSLVASIGLLLAIGGPMWLMALVADSARLLSHSALLVFVANTSADPSKIPLLLGTFFLLPVTLSFVSFLMDRRSHVRPRLILIIPAVCLAFLFLLSAFGLSFPIVSTELVPP